MKTQEEITAAYKALYHTATWTDGETFVQIAATVENLREGYAMRQFSMMQRNPLDFAIKWPALTAALIDNYLND
jgi:hypothetical protein